MTTINRLTAVSDLNAADQLPVYSTESGDARKASMTVFAEYIRSIITGLTVSQGGTGLSSITVNGVMLGNGTNAIQTVSPGASGRVLMSDGTTWNSEPSSSVAAGTADVAYSLKSNATTGKIEIVGPAIGTTRVMTLPDANATILTNANVVTVAQGGTGANTLTLNNVLLGNGTGALQVVAPGASGNILTSDGTTWASSALTGITVGDTSMTITDTGANGTITFKNDNVESLKLSSSGYLGLKASSINQLMTIGGAKTYGTPTYDQNITLYGPADDFPFFITQAYGGSVASEAGSFAIRRNRGTLAAPTVTQSGDVFGYFLGQGYNSTLAQFSGAQFYFEQSGAATASGNPTDIVFLSNDGTNRTGTERLRITSEGVIQIGSSAVYKIGTDGSSVPFGGLRFGYQAAPTSKAAAATLTGAELAVGMLEYTGGAANVQFPTGTQIQSAISSLIGNNNYFDWCVVNTGAGTCTMTTNTDLTLKGLMTIPTNTSAEFRIRRTASNTFTIYRI